MSEQKYYVFQKSLDGKKIVSQLVRCKFMSENAEFVPVIHSESGRYENSFSKFTKIELEKMMDGALYKRADWVMDDKTCRWLYEWINPLIELVPIYEVEP